MDWNALIGGLSGAAVLLVGKCIEWYREWSASRSKDKLQVAEEQLRQERQRAELSLPLNEQAVRVYKDLIDSLRADMNKLVDNMHFQDKMLLDCKETCLGLKVANDALKAENAAVKAENAALKDDVAGLHRRVGELESRPAPQEKRP